MSFTAYRSIFNNVGRDQHTHYYFVNNIAPAPCLEVDYNHIRNTSHRHYAQPLEASPRENALDIVAGHHSSPAVSIIDLSTRLVHQIAGLLVGNSEYLNRYRDLKTELEFYGQTLLLSKSATQVFKHTPLDRISSNTINTEVERCFVVLRSTFDKISHYRQRLRSTTINFLWPAVCWNGWDKAELRQLILKLSAHRNDLDGFLIALNSYVIFCFHPAMPLIVVNITVSNGHSSEINQTLIISPSEHFPLFSNNVCLSYTTFRWLKWTLSIIWVV
jgi:hypothetical protein